MNLVKPYAKLIVPVFGRGDTVFTQEHGIELLQRIEWAGRISHRSEDKQDADTWKRFIQAVVVGHGDWSIVEHASVSVDMLVDRGITHEIVRHRLFSFTQESTRFVNYEKKMPASFIEPDGMEEDAALHQTWVTHIERCEEQYKFMLAHGAAPQIARSVFPNALASRIIISGNLRNWRHFLIMRTTRESHPQMREVTIPLLEQFKACIPILFDDITPLDRQSEAIKKAR